MEDVLVSVVVVSYNSSEFILETLDSIKNQSYINLELIITDDSSTDNTVSKCEEWLEVNKSRFVRVKLISPEKNTGIPANCNRGVREANGEWVKLIAGDDLLAKDSIKLLMEDVKPEKDIIIGSMKRFFVQPDGTKKIESMTIPQGYDFFFKWNAKKQNRYLLLHRPGFAAGAFIRRSLYDKVGYYDEQYTYMEDLPFWIKATKKGVKIWRTNSAVALYRMHESVSHVQKLSYVNIRYYDCIKKVDKECLMKNIPWYCFSFWESIWLYHFRYWVLINLFNNKKSLLGDLFSKVTSCLRIERFFNPLENFIYNKVLYK